MGKVFVDKNVRHFTLTKKICSHDHFCNYLRQINDSKIAKTIDSPREWCCWKYSFLNKIYFTIDYWMQPVTILRNVETAKTNKYISWKFYTSFEVRKTKIWIVTWLFSVLLFLGGDVELNLEPKQCSTNTSSICHWNLSGISHNYEKIFLLKAYIAIHKFDVICLSETYLILILRLMITIWKFLVITWYYLIILQTENEDLFVHLINIIYLWKFSIFNICKNVLILKGKLGSKVCNFISLYRSPNQTIDDFETFSKNLELNFKNIVQRNPFEVVAIGDFNAKSSKSTTEGNAIDNITSQFRSHQVIREPTHIADTSSSCMTSHLRQYLI